MTDPTLIAASALTALNHVKTLVADALGLRVDREVGEKLIAIQSALVTANNEILSFQERHAALLEENDQLKREILKLRDALQDREQYVLQAIVPGVFAYVAQADVDPALERQQSPVYLCQCCYDQGQKCVLQWRQKSPLGGAWCCPKCNTELLILNERAPASLRQAPR